MTIQIEKVEQLLEYTFSDQGLPVQALTHPSYLHESGGDGGDYQRLEFLGDAVLGLLLGELLYLRHTDWHEGSLSQVRSRLAGQDLLADRARWLGIGAFIQLGRGEEQSAGREKDSILADVLEAVIGALYLDGGLQAARALVVRLFDEAAAAPEELALGRDAKSELQEYLTLHGCSPPEYRLAEESGPPHERQFCFHLFVDDRLIGTATGKSKKIAQQAAAAMALTTLQSPHGQGGA